MHERERIIREVVEGITCTGPDGRFVQIRVVRGYSPFVYCVVTQQEMLEALLPAARAQDAANDHLRDSMKAWPRPVPPPPPPVKKTCPHCGGVL